MSGPKLKPVSKKDFDQFVSVHSLEEIPNGHELLGHDTFVDNKIGLCKASRFNGYDDDPNSKPKYFLWKW